jgi:hypothetical protein
VKLYFRKDDGKIVGTQKEAGRASNRVDFEVPTDKTGLIGWLNRNLNPQQDVASEKSHSDYTIEDFSSWLHIQPGNDDLVRGLREAVSRFKNDRRETAEFIKELDMK